MVASSLKRLVFLIDVAGIDLNRKVHDVIAEKDSAEDAQVVKRGKAQQGPRIKKRLQRSYQGTSQISGSSFASFHDLLAALLDAQTASQAASGVEAPKSTLTQLVRYLATLATTVFSDLQSHTHQENSPHNVPRHVSGDASEERSGLVVMVSPTPKSLADLTSFLDLTSTNPLFGQHGLADGEVAAALQQAISPQLVSQFEAAGVRLCWLDSGSLPSAPKGAEAVGWRVGCWQAKQKRDAAAMREVLTRLAEEANIHEDDPEAAWAEVRRETRERQRAQKLAASRQREPGVRSQSGVLHAGPAPRAAAESMGQAAPHLGEVGDSITPLCSRPGSPAGVLPSAPPSTTQPAEGRSQSVPAILEQAVRARNNLVEQCRVSVRPVPVNEVAQQAADLVRHVASQLLRSPTSAVLAHIAPSDDASEADQAPPPHSVAAHVNIRKALLPALLTDPVRLLQQYRSHAVGHLSMSVLVVELVMRLQAASIKAGPTKKEMPKPRRQEVLLLFEWLMSAIPTPPFGGRAFFRDMLCDQYSVMLPGVVKELELMAFGDDEPVSSPDSKRQALQAEAEAPLDPNNPEVVVDSDQAGPSRGLTGDDAAAARAGPSSRPSTSEMSGQHSGVSHRSAAAGPAGPSARGRAAFGQKRTYHNAAKRVGMNGQALDRRQVRLKGRPAGGRQDGKPADKPLHRLAGKDSKAGGQRQKKGNVGTPRRVQKAGQKGKDPKATPTSRRKVTPMSDESMVPPTSQKASQKAGPALVTDTASKLKRKLAFGSLPVSYAIDEDEDEQDDLLTEPDKQPTAGAAEEGRGDNDCNWMTSAVHVQRPAPRRQPAGGRPGGLMRFNSEAAPSTAGLPHQQLQHSASLPAGMAGAAGNILSIGTRRTYACE
ncbi:hypothetical protein WJX72_005205 [[Myrmecia] bisecta]|uniref:Uncharacterized protein n=1 Tax=[Myrmecia] bisecta TaxID=41462 RepID=A0AAW1PPV7_9CHLO